LLFGWPGMPPQPEPAQDSRLALIVAASEYSDRTFQQLRAPGRDADELAEVLRDPTIGGFEVSTLLNARSDELLRGIAEFCADRGPTDLLLLYLSCHGVLDDRGRLYYVTVNTERRLLAATAVPAQWLNEQLEDCRARRQILLLDCCHSGAFAKGGKGDTTLALGDRLGGRGRVVITASRGTEYSFEGDRVLGEGVASVFTSAVVEGLRTGDADRDRDGLITVADLYDYVYSRVKATEPRQTPALWTYGAEGDLLIARSPRGPIIEPTPLPEDLRVALESPRPRVRESGVAELAEILDGDRPGLALAAQLALQRIADEDVPQVAAIARAALSAVHGESADKVRRGMAQRTREAEAHGQQETSHGAFEDYRLLARAPASEDEALPTDTIRVPIAKESEQQDDEQPVASRAPASVSPTPDGTKLAARVLLVVAVLLTTSLTVLFVDSLSLYNNTAPLGIFLWPRVAVAGAIITTAAAAILARPTALPGKAASLVLLCGGTGTLALLVWANAQDGVNPSVGWLWTDAGGGHSTLREWGSTAAVAVAAILAVSAAAGALRLTRRTRLVIGVALVCCALVVLDLLAARWAENHNHDVVTGLFRTPARYAFGTVLVTAWAAFFAVFPARPDPPTARTARVTSVLALVATLLTAWTLVLSMHGDRTQYGSDHLGSLLASDGLYRTFAFALSAMTILAAVVLAVIAGTTARSSR
jgi:hypothetical protein